MEASECKVGDRILLFLDNDGRLSDLPTNDTITTTVVRTADDGGIGVLVAWKKNEPYPIFARKVSSFTANSNRNALVGYDYAVVLGQGQRVAPLTASEEAPLIHIHTPVSTDDIMEAAPIPAFDFDRYNGFR